MKIEWLAYSTKLGKMVGSSICAKPAQVMLAEGEKVAGIKTYLPEEKPQLRDGAGIKYPLRPKKGR